MRLQTDPRLPDPNTGNGTVRLTQRLYEIFRDWANIINHGLFWETSGLVAPTTGNWATGDKCRNTNPTELGSGGSKYIIIGWCYTGGSWKDMRVLTGN